MAEKKPKPKTEVTILSRREITTFPKLKQPVVSVAVTYQSGAAPPRTIFIPKVTWSKEAEAAAIKKDIEAQRVAAPETITI